MTMTNHTIFDVIRNAAAATARPLTATMLYKRADIKKFAENVDKVSNALGTLYRSGTLKRVAAPASPDSRAKFAYLLTGAARTKGAAKPPSPPALRATRAAAVAKPERKKKQKKQMTRVKRAARMSARSEAAFPIAMRGLKPSVRIHQSGDDVVVDMPKMRIVIAMT